MSAAVMLEPILMAEPVNPGLEEAARLLDLACSATNNDPHAAYMLALAYKRQGKPAEARAALRRIANPDANDLLQMGVLFLDESLLAEAEHEFECAWCMSSGYEAGYNLVLTRLTLGRAESCIPLLGKVIELAPQRDDSRFLGHLHCLLTSIASSNPAPTEEGPPAGDLEELAPDEERRLLTFLRGIRSFEVSYALLRAIASARPASAPAQQALLQAAILEGKRSFDRCDWGETARLLAPLAREIVASRAFDRPVQAATLSLLGCCACMQQDFERGSQYFASALRLLPNDARIRQNLALACEWQNQLDQAEPEWARFLDMLDDGLPAPPDRPGYFQDLAFEGLNHLAETYSKAEHWSKTLGYLQSALRLRPDDVELQDRMFHLYAQLKRPEEAARLLHRMRKLRPHDSQLELYELDLREARSLDQIDRMVCDIGHIMKRYPDDTRVEDRAAGMVANLLPLMGRLCDQLTAQVGKVVEQARLLPSYEINWSGVREVMEEVEDDFLKLRSIGRSCMPLVNTDEQRRVLRELGLHIDRKIDECARLGG